MPTLEVKGSRNYCAVITDIKSLKPIEGADRIQVATIFGNSVIVGKDVHIGDIGVYFPLECAISKSFLGPNNLYRKAEYGNKDSDSKGGFFGKNGRVKAIRMKGVASEGFFAPIEMFECLAMDMADASIGSEFNYIGGVMVCRKYTPVFHASRQQPIEFSDQLQFHYDTGNLRRNIRSINSEDIISVTEKWHGCAAIIANLPVKRELSFIDRVAKFFGVEVVETEYALTWCSRRVVKGVGGKKTLLSGYYSEDVWGVEAAKHGHKIPKGYSLYGEIVGYTPSGQAIQKGYGYGCEPGTSRFLAYRATVTSEDGVVCELSRPQLADFCLSRGIECVNQIHYGPASDITPRGDNWHERFLADLERIVNIGNCRHNDYRVPAEGIVVGIDHFGKSEKWKLKQFSFLEGETKSLDSGEVDIETAEEASVSGQDPE